MHIYQQANNPLEIARFRVFLFEGSKRLPVLAEVVLGLIHSSLILFFWGLGDIILHIDMTIFVVILVPILICVGLSLLHNCTDSESPITLWDTILKFNLVPHAKNFAQPPL